MRLKINSCGFCDCLPEWKWHTEGFPDYDFWAVFRGEGTIRPQNEKEIAVHDGICLLLTPNTSYNAKHNPSRPLLVFNVHFHFLNDDGDIIYPEKLQTKISTDHPFCKELLSRVISFYNSNDEETALIYLSAVLSEFFHAETPENAENNSVWVKITNEICTEIDSKPQTPSLSFFAKKYGYTERYIGKMFSQIKKISFSDYTQNARINKAKTCLRLTDMSIGAIAEELGYCDACHFTKNFRKLVGISPIAYRKIQKTENL